MSRTTSGWLRAAVFDEGSPDGVARLLPRHVDEADGTRSHLLVVYSLATLFEYVLVAGVTLTALIVLAATGVLSATDPTVLRWAAVAVGGSVYLVDAVVAAVSYSPLDVAVTVAFLPVERFVVERYLVSVPDGIAHSGYAILARFDRSTTETTTAETTLYDEEVGHEVDVSLAALGYGTNGTVTADSLAAGDRFGSYELQRPIDTGRFSFLWEGVADDGSVVALKVFDPQLEGSTRRLLEADFLHEAEVLDTIGDHDHVVDIHDWGREPQPWLAVEYVEADSVREQLPLSPPAARTVLLAVADALAYAHEHDVSHGDLKPENVLYDGDSDPPLVLLIDWGMRPLADHHVESLLTPAYAAPEQFDDVTLDEHRAELVDVYQLGLLAYELFTDEQPFLGYDDSATIEEHVRSDVPPLPSDRRPDLPSELDRVVMTALDETPTNRYQDVDAFADALTAVPLPE
jgi:hypothetical protein